MLCPDIVSFGVHCSISVSDLLTALAHPPGTQLGVGGQIPDLRPLLAGCPARDFYCKVLAASLLLELLRTNCFPAEDCGKEPEPEQGNGPELPLDRGTMGSDTVRVVVRVRPLADRERAESAVQCVRCLDSRQLVVGKDRSFSFDHVFHPTSSQGDVFSHIVALVDSFLDGYHATVFAYGQTGSGKTYTMGGDTGIVPRFIHELFLRFDSKQRVGGAASPSYERDSLDGLGSAHRGTQTVPDGFVVRCTFIEILNEELRDLLHPSTPSRAIAIRETAVGAIFLSGVKEERVSSFTDLMDCYHRGFLSRTVGSTMMNEESSRSHSIFTVALVQSREGRILESKFHLVDLAGSERNKRTGVLGQRFKESININSGLLALGKVISALSEEDTKRKRPDKLHIPYRDSKLTRLLQDSLGGNSKTVMIACISPAESSFEESLNTLKYASRAKFIVNQPVQNNLLESNVAEVQVLQKQVLDLGSAMEDGRAAGAIHQQLLVDSLLPERVADLGNKILAFQAAKDQHHIAVGTSFEYQSPELLEQIQQHQATIRQMQEEAFALQQQYQSVCQELSAAKDDLLQDEEIFAEKVEEIRNLQAECDHLREVLSEIQNVSRMAEAGAQAGSSISATGTAQADSRPSSSVSSRPVSSASEALAARLEEELDSVRLAHDDLDFSLPVEKDASLTGVSGDPSSIPSFQLLPPPPSGRLESLLAEKNHELQRVRSEWDVAQRAGQSKLEELEQLLNRIREEKEVLLLAMKSESDENKKKFSALRREAMAGKKKLRELEAENARQRLILERKQDESRNNGVARGPSKAGGAKFPPPPSESVSYRPQTAPSQHRLGAGGGTAPGFGAAGQGKVEPSLEARWKQLNFETARLVREREANKKLAEELRERERIILERERALGRKTVLETQKRHGGRNLRESLMELDKEISVLQEQLNARDQHQDQHGGRRRRTPGSAREEESWAGRAAGVAATAGQESASASSAELSLAEGDSSAVAAHQVRRELSSAIRMRDALVGKQADDTVIFTDDDERQLADLTEYIDVLSAEVEFKDLAIQRLASDRQHHAGSPHQQQERLLPPSVKLEQQQQQQQHDHDHDQHQHQQTRATESSALVSDLSSPSSSHIISAVAHQTPSAVGLAESSNVSACPSVSQIISGMGNEESRMIIEKYVDQVVSLKEENNRLAQMAAQLSGDVSAKDKALANMEKTMRLVEIDFDRRMARQTQEFNAERESLVRQMQALAKATPMSTAVAQPAPSPAHEELLKQARVRDDDISVLEKDNYYYRQTNKELKRKLRELMASFDEEKANFERQNGQMLKELENLKSFAGLHSVRKSVSQLRPMQRDEVEARRSQSSLGFHSSPDASAENLY